MTPLAKLEALVEDAYGKEAALSIDPRFLLPDKSIREDYGYMATVWDKAGRKILSAWGKDKGAVMVALRRELCAKINTDGGADDLEADG